MNVVEDARNESLGQARERRWRRLSMVELLAALALLFFSAPFVEGLKAGPLIESALFSVVLLSGVLAVADRRRTLAIAFALAVPAVALRWMHHLWPDAIPIVAFLVIGLLLIVFLAANLLRFILRAAAVDLEVICASLSGYLMLGLAWSVAYWLVAELNPNAFSFNTAASAHETMETTNAFYFSFITLSTVGYGDITPATKIARMLAAMEAVTGMLYVAVLIARLVSLYSRNSGDSSDSN